jgi:putative cardiolipin synthase
MKQALAGSDSGPYAAALARSRLEYLEDGVDLDTWVPYQFVYDPPVKPETAQKKDEKESSASILTPLRATLESTREELIVASPYFVLEDSTIQEMGEFVRSGVTIKVITNSLASTNHDIVHSGYGPTRKPLLEEGVGIYELRPDAYISGVKSDATSRSSLHTKAFIVDRRWVFLGSFNWDPRSAYINTESGIIIDHPAMAAGMAERTDTAIPIATYTVYLNEKSQVRWKTTGDDGEEVVFTHEPETGWWRRFKVKLLGLLPVKGQL